MTNEKRIRTKTWRDDYKRNIWRQKKLNKNPKLSDSNDSKLVINVSLITSFLKDLGDLPWYETLKQLSLSISQSEITDGKVDYEVLLQHGTDLLNKYGKSYSINVSQVDYDEKWLHSSAIGGEGVTKGDMLNSLALLVEHNPILNFFCIKKLLDILQSNVNRDRITALNVLHTLFLEKLLPNRKLLFMSEYAPLLSYIANSPYEITETTEITPKSTELLLLITFEHHIKLAFAVYVEIIGRGINDHLYIFQKTCIDIATDLLTKQPEQEFALLQMLTRNISHSNTKISSKISWNLRQVTGVHKGFKIYIIKLLGNTLDYILKQMRINYKSTTRWKYSKHDKHKGLSQKVQENLISITKLLNFLSEIQNNDDTKTLETLLGVYISFISIFFSEKLKTIYVKEESSRVIRAMTIGLDKCLNHINNINNNFKESMKAYIDTLYKITHTVKSKATKITLLGLIYRCTMVFGLPKSRFYRIIYDKLQNLDLFGTSNEKRLYVILHQILANDNNLPRMSAFIKRILQSSMHMSNSSITLACILIIQNIIKNNKKLKILFKSNTSNEKDFTLNATNEKATNEKAATNEKTTNEKFFNERNLTSGAATNVNKNGSNSLKASNVEKIPSFDPDKRDPEFSNADTSYLWERHLLNSSYDPAINSVKIDGKIKTSKIINLQKLNDKVQHHDTFKKLEFLVNSHDKLQYNQHHLQVYRKFFDLQPKKIKTKHSDHTKSGKQNIPDEDADEDIDIDYVDDDFDENNDMISSDSGSEYEFTNDIVNFEEFKNQWVDHIPKDLEKILKNKSFINADELDKYVNL